MTATASWQRSEVVGDFLGVPDKAEALQSKVRADLDAAVADAAKRPESERKRVIFILSTAGRKDHGCGYRHGRRRHHRARRRR